MSSFKHSVINYNKVEEFGGSIDYTSQVVLKVVEKDEQVEVKEGESEVVSNLMEEINKKNTPWVKTLLQISNLFYQNFYFSSNFYNKKL